MIGERHDRRVVGDHRGSSGVMPATRRSGRRRNDAEILADRSPQTPRAPGSAAWRGLASPRF
jgi:hypothetical protein